MIGSTLPRYALLATVLIGSQMSLAQGSQTTDLPDAPVPQQSRPVLPARQSCIPNLCASEQRICCAEHGSPALMPFEWYRIPEPLTPGEKLKLAWLGFRDPFNLMTIAGEAGITIGSDAHTAYGPGFSGFGKYAGISASQNAISDFFCVFFIPSLAHQDPRYYRVPNLPLTARIEHGIASVAVGRADDGRPMFNYAAVFGTIATSALGNAYIPGRRVDFGATSSRIMVALATAPAGNAVAEFLPDVARHININVVLVQRVINRVAVRSGSVPQP